MSTILKKEPFQKKEGTLLNKFFKASIAQTKAGEGHNKITKLTIQFL